MVVIGIYKIATDTTFRQSFLGEIRASSVESVFIYAWVGCGLLFFWGVFVPALGEIRIRLFGHRYELWALAGLASLAGFMVMVIYTWLANRGR